MGGAERRRFRACTVGYAPSGESRNGVEDAHVGGGRKCRDQHRRMVMRRWQEIDPLLPEPGPLPQGCGTEFTIAGAPASLRPPRPVSIARRHRDRWTPPG